MLVTVSSSIAEYTSNFFTLRLHSLLPSVTTHQKTKKSTAQKNKTTAEAWRWLSSHYGIGPTITKRLDELPPHVLTRQHPSNFVAVLRPCVDSPTIAQSRGSNLGDRSLRQIGSPGRSPPSCTCRSGTPIFFESAGQRNRSRSLAGRFSHAIPQFHAARRSPHPAQSSDQTPARPDAPPLLPTLKRL